MIITRSLDLNALVLAKSCFLFGPRQTGKSTWIETSFPAVTTYDLLESDTFRRLNAEPERLRKEILESKTKLVAIDEIQKAPALLDEVHLLIEKHKVRFILTGSSPRKLNKNGVNLLGGRATTQLLHPYTQRELKSDFDLTLAINNGLLPPHYHSGPADRDLADYVGSYLQNEIANEGATRNVPAFSRFLEVAALSNGQLINFTSVASDAQVKVSTVTNYFQILEDTLIGYTLEPWIKTKTRKAIATPKFYFFDTGVCRVLQGRKQIVPGTREFGEYFETYLLHEVRCAFDYRQIKTKLNYWRSTSNFEVDLILGNEHAIEIKAKKEISNDDLKGLRAIYEEKLLKSYTLVALVKTPQKIGNIRVLPYQQFLKELWDGRYD